MQFLKASILISSLMLAACQHASIRPIQSAQVTAPPVMEAESRLDKSFYKYRRSSGKPVVALVLGSGGARGYAHIGVIEVLEKYGIRPDFIVGVSAGSIVGSIYASGKNAAQLRDIAMEMKVADVRDFTIGLKGFFDGKKVESYVNQQVDSTPLENMKIPMYVVATELKEGRKVVFNYGNTGQAVRASVSIPSMFVPTKIAGKEYVDGGLVSPVPVNVARDLGADVIIAVDILAQPVHTETTNVWGLFNQNINIMQNKLAIEEMKNADIIIQPDLRRKAHIFDVKGRQDTIDAGVEATMERIKDIEVVLKNKQARLNAAQ
ncbi:patatin-like phospholipase family protein [Acinetobacter sp. WZC-1]|uniref:patatin-like phospholipase family protein n=1 Tax=Acinetobacter sp. WZC-1 TaxID=3459034 RepID=UPI00403DF021